jgi:hypothetical protein
MTTVIEDASTVKHCDECGQVMTVAHRIFEGKHYGSCCYAKVFVTCSCSRCGESTRAHRFQSEPICRVCDRETRTCIRCDKQVERAGLRIGTGVVCPACVPYFHDRQTCQRCGEKAFRLSRAPTLGIEESICDQCRNKLTHATCSRCRKYRAVVERDEDDKALCKDCSPGQEVSHVCGGCGSNVPGGGESDCLRCYNQKSVQAHASTATAALENEWARQFLLDYSQWLLDTRPEKPALHMQLFKDNDFFLKLDRGFAKKTDITEVTLLQYFGTAVLRKHLLASRFLGDWLSLTMTTASKVESAEQQRVQSILSMHAAQPFGVVLVQYEQWLDIYRTQTRTKRLYLSAAAMFASAVELSEQVPPSDSACAAYFHKKPGQRNNVGRFFRFLTDKYQWALPLPEKKTKTGIPTTVHRLKSQLSIIADVGIDNASHSVLVHVMAVSLGFTEAQLTPFPLITRHGKDMAMQVNGENLSLLAPIDSIAKEIYRRQQSAI